MSEPKFPPMMTMLSPNEKPSDAAIGLPEATEALRAVIAATEARTVEAIADWLGSLGHVNCAPALLERLRAGDWRGPARATTWKELESTSRRPK